MVGRRKKDVKDVTGWAMIEPGGEVLFATVGQSPRKATNCKIGSSYVEFNRELCDPEDVKKWDKDKKVWDRIRQELIDKGYRLMEVKFVPVNDERYLLWEDDDTSLVHQLHNFKDY